MEVRFADSRMKGDLFFPSCADAAADFIQWLRKLLAAYDFHANDASAIRLAVEEALLNAIRHGNRMHRSKCVYVTVAMGKKIFYIRIRDEGEGFNPAEISDSTDTKDSKQLNKRGLWLMRRCMDEVRFNEKGNEVTLIRRRSSV